ncbi:hypothetical protein [Fodinibius saliphilus]|uniref:hypothetical protein n=1 Tax=Fodinibius saliphilus TaxID=1920650 RepID=UPI00110942EC|nr:hypothetical protein [Fodinibius saliphilus]
MNRSIIVTIHAASSTIALFLIASFFISTVIVELLGTLQYIQLVKQYIVYGLVILVPAMAISGLSGNKLGGSSKAKPIQQKKQRMIRIMLLGLTVLLPSAVVLHYLAQSTDFGGLFYSIQLVEFVAGGTNIYLMAQNMKSGLILSGRMPQKVQS